VKIAKSAKQVISTSFATAINTSEAFFAFLSKRKNTQQVHGTA